MEIHICEVCGKENEIKRDKNDNIIKEDCSCCDKTTKEPTKQEIIEYMNAYNEDEIGLNNPIDYEEAEYQLLLSDKYHK